MSTESFDTILLKYADGNIGALNFLMKTFGNPEADIVNALQISNKLKRCTSIRGTNIYVLFSDLCDGDIDRVAQVCENVPDEILEEACNRQDYSGRELIQEFVVNIDQE